jgi:drug/metabolite transporter (DMT)-like permease
MNAPSAQPAASSMVKSPVGQTRAYLALIAGVLCISFSPIFARTAAVDGEVIGFYRLGIAAVVLTGMVIINARRGRVRLPRKAIGLVTLAGLAFAADMALWNTTLMYIHVSVSTLLSNTAPLWVGLGAWLIFRESLRPIYWIGLLVALGGVGVIVGWDSLRGLGLNVYIMLALASGVAYAAYQLITQQARRQVDTVTYLWMFSVIGSLSLLVLALALGHPVTGFPVKSYLALIALALVSHLGGWLLINYAMGHLRISLVTVILLLQPVLVTLLAMPLLGEFPDEWQVVGGIITLIGIYIVHRSVSGKVSLEEV